jgi:mRNA-degrading endonuclease RelE of RelBE toxin-antitoxin system
VAELQYSKQAIKYMRRMPDKQARKTRQALQSIAAGCHKGLNIKRMNKQNAYRLRQGGIRAMYSFRDGGRVMVVAKVGSRGDFYK